MTDADLSSALDEDALAAMQDNLSDLLSDINRQVLHGLENVDSCLQALAIGKSSLTPPPADPMPPGNPSSALDESVLPATPESMALIPIWRSEYATRRKFHKQNLRQTEDAADASLSAHGDTSLMIIHDVNVAPVN